MSKLTADGSRNMTDREIQREKEVTANAALKAKIDSFVASQPPSIQAKFAQLRAEREADASLEAAPDGYRGADAADAPEFVKIVGGEQSLAQRSANNSIGAGLTRQGPVAGGGKGAAGVTTI